MSNPQHLAAAVSGESAPRALTRSSTCRGRDTVQVGLHDPQVNMSRRTTPHVPAESPNVARVRFDRPSSGPRKPCGRASRP